MRKLWIAIAAVAVVVIGGGAAIYFLVFPNDSPAPLTLSSTGTTVAGSATTAASSDPSSSDPSSSAGTPVTADNLAGTWKVTDGSIAGYRVREKLAQLPAKSDAVGRTSDVTGTVTIDGPPFMVSAADLTVDVTTLASDSDRRDGQIKRRGLETDTYPTATFKLTQPVAIPAEALSGSPVTVQATGDMTIHGVTKSVTIPLQTQINGDKIEIVGSLTFPMSDFGIDPPTIAGIVDVESNATLEFQVFLAE
ncbi:MAG TPA: YceI family protein [Acidimicrobiales bacterium]|nr:YceI family protein [Acidimicrobiales bacterium]